MCQHGPVKTSSWWAKLPEGHVRIGICRGVPKKTEPGTMNYQALAPRFKMKGLPPREFETAYDEYLGGLDADLILARIEQLADGKVPVLVCWESAHHINAGRCWCHRHLVARWLERELGIEVEEVGWPQLDRFRFLTDPQPFPEKQDKPKPKKPATVVPSPKSQLSFGF
jgi:hypothetical protein